MNKYFQFITDKTYIISEYFKRITECLYNYDTCI